MGVKTKYSGNRCLFFGLPTQVNFFRAFGCKLQKHVIEV